MNYILLKSAKRILQTVSEHNGQYTWYNIVKIVDQLNDVEKIPPTYEVIKTLVSLNYLRRDPPEGGNNAKHWITVSGSSLLKENPWG